VLQKSVSSKKMAGASGRKQSSTVYSFIMIEDAFKNQVQFDNNFT